MMPTLLHALVFCKSISLLLSTSSALLCYQCGGGNDTHPVINCNDGQDKKECGAIISENERDPVPLCRNYFRGKETMLKDCVLMWRDEARKANSTDCGPEENEIKDCYCDFEDFCNRGIWPSEEYIPSGSLRTGVVSRNLFGVASLMYILT